MTDREIAFAIAGFAVGLAVCRWIYTLMIGCTNLTMRDLCKFNHNRRCS